MKLSVVILTKNEGGYIEDCLHSVGWADEIILLDGKSTDQTLPIARRLSKKHPIRIASQPKTKGINWAVWRKAGLKAAKGDWIFYLDADERVTPALEKEINQAIKDNAGDVLAIPRQNYLLGKAMHWGGWWPDYVTRIFRRESLKKWVGKLHEQPVYEGKLVQLKEPMIHLQPDSVGPMLQKSIGWSKVEADLLYKVGHPPVVWWRILRMGATTLLKRLIKKQGFRDGTEGWIMSIYQAFHTMIVYMQLWEMQQTGSKKQRLGTHEETNY